MKYTIFAHESEYKLQEELDNATSHDLAACDWNNWAYTIKEWPKALEAMQHSMGYICIMDQNLKVHKEWKRR